MSNALYVYGALLQAAALFYGARPGVAGLGVVCVGLAQIACWWYR